MCSRTVIVLFLLSVAFVFTIAEQNDIEARGKKKKIALFVYFADLVIKKIFILKLIYAFVFWVVLHKAGYFLGWFASYLKEKKEDDHHHYGHHHHYEPPYVPYRRKAEPYVYSTINNSEI
ncbi:uncharacterized protein LOC128200524 [Galleria mellonella]|uniref:Uncharacterized protein LOC128200524 n=1 Tax=Galleria mellonella TaxID=7137 RepID=A0ABM3MFI7_GALME|nr:uncharacterized protein LOC128200524 [Galleria mellonella]